MGTIDNPSSSSSPDGSPADFKFLSTKAAPNSTLQFSANVGGPSNGDPLEFAIWVDWNGDEDFADAGEAVFRQDVTQSSTEPVSGSIKVPQGLPNITTVMRVAEFYKPESNLSTEGCGNMDSGEGEDYTIIVEGSSKTRQPASDGGDRFALHPSSSSREFFLVLPEGAVSVELTAFDLKGEKVWGLSKKRARRIPIHFGNLKNGIYSLRINTGDQSIAKTILLK